MQSLALYQLKHDLYFHKSHGPYDDGGFGNFHKNHRDREEFARSRGIYETVRRNNPKIFEDDDHQKEYY